MAVRGCACVCVCVRPLPRRDVVSINNIPWQSAPPPCSRVPPAPMHVLPPSLCRSLRLAPCACVVCHVWIGCPHIPTAAAAASGAGGAGAGVVTLEALAAAMQAVTGQAEPPTSLRHVVDLQSVLPMLQDEAVQARLLPLLPESQRTPQGLVESVRCRWHLLRARLLDVTAHELTCACPGLIPRVPGSPRDVVGCVANQQLQLRVRQLRLGPCRRCRAHGTWRRHCRIPPRT